MSKIVFEALAEAARKKEGVVLGIITGVKGSSPQKVGAEGLRRMYLERFASAMRN